MQYRLVIALSLVFFAINYAYSLYQTFAMVVVAYFMLLSSMAQTTLRGLLEIDGCLITSKRWSKCLGRSNFYIFRTLVIPAMLPGIAMRLL